MSKQSKYYLPDELKERVRVHVALNSKTYANMSVFIREAIKEKLEREEKK
jgi:Arc/MetJ-type ribon-helix-helix transcriptional regulator